MAIVKRAFRLKMLFQLVDEVETSRESSPLTNGTHNYQTTDEGRSSASLHLIGRRTGSIRWLAVG